MIRLHTVFWLSLIAVASAIVFHVSYRVQSLEDDLGQLNRSIRFERESIRILNAEWAYLTRPDRLRALVDAHTDLTALQPRQMIQSVWDIPEPPPNSEFRVAAPRELAALNMPVIPIPRHRPGASDDEWIGATGIGPTPVSASLEDIVQQLPSEVGSAP